MRHNIGHASIRGMVGYNQYFIKSGGFSYLSTTNHRNNYGGQVIKFLLFFDGIFQVHTNICITRRTTIMHY